MNLPVEIWTLLGTIGTGLLTALGVVWKLYLDEKRSKETQSRDFYEKRHADQLKLVEMLLKVQQGYESLMNVSTKIDGMITSTEKLELVTAMRDIKRDIETIAKKVTNE